MTLTAAPGRLQNDATSVPGGDVDFENAPIAPGVIYGYALADVDILPRMKRWAECASRAGAGMCASRRPAIGWGRLALVAVAVLASPGCALLNTKTDPPPLPTARVLVVAPVLNLSGSDAFDSLKVTDLIASEFLSFEGISVIPINLTLVELARHGKEMVGTPEDAFELARAFGADATVVIGVTEYDPYEPPVVGLVMQWYDAPRRPTTGTDLDPVSASRALSSPEAALSDDRPAGPRWQLQRVFNAADETLLEDLQAFAAEREGHRSPFGWRKYTKSQELYVRYCGHALFRTMLEQDERYRAAMTPNEARL